MNISIFLENIDRINESIRRRGLDLDTEKITRNTESWKKATQKVEQLRHQINSASKEKPSDEEIEKLRALKADLVNYEEDLRVLEEDLKNHLAQLPNLVSPESPDGGEEDFKILKEWGDKPVIDNPKDHEDLGQELDLIDFEAGSKVAGSKFYYLKNEAVILEFALIQYALKILLEEGFIPMITPQIVKNEVLEGIGFLPKGPEKQVYGLDNEGLSLIGTSEITLGGYHMGEVLSSTKLPLKYAGFSTCFRTEAGAYGRHSKGLYRVHQFDKLEMFIYCLPEDSEKMHEYLLSLEEKIFQGLEIPYRVVDIAAGDLGAPAYRKFDIEAWMPGRGDYGEITSASNTTDYQSMRLNEKYEKNGVKGFVHTLNGTAVAIGRTLIAIFENYQEDRSVKIPEVLVPYTGFSEIRPK